MIRSRCTRTSNLNLTGVDGGQPAIEARDRFNEVEALSGWNLNDQLFGDDVVPATVGGGGFIGCDALDQDGLDRIAGLDALVPPLTTDPAPIEAATTTRYCGLVGNVWGAGNILLGGGGSDTIEGRGADDIIDGDKYLGVRLSVRTDVNNPATQIGTTDLMTKVATSGNFGPGTAGMTLQQAVFAGLVDPGKIAIVREILTPATALLTGTTDTAVFSAPLAGYTVVHNRRWQRDRQRCGRRERRWHRHVVEHRAGQVLHQPRCGDRQVPRQRDALARPPGGNGVDDVGDLRCPRGRTPVLPRRRPSR